MPSSWAFHFASGNSLFSGTVLVLAGVMVRGCSWPRGSDQIGRVGVLTGATFIGLSSTPLLWPLYVAWMAALLWAWRRPVAWRASASTPGRTSDGPGRGEKSSWRRFLPLWALLTVSLLCCGLEIGTVVASRRAAPARPATVYVIGDSLSALGDPAWPELLAERHHVPVVNLARAGATVDDALEQARRVPANVPALVVVEIGGNDMLASRPSDEFRAGLERLLQSLDGSERQLVMLELPLPPGRHGFGYAQRELAGKHSAVLVSKRVLAGVLASADTTLDGLHLSAAGHSRLAERLAPVLMPYVRPSGR